MACTNAGVLPAIDGLLEADPNAVVMITGDHGSGSTRLAQSPPEDWSDAGIHERMAILSAYRLPGCEGMFRPNLTPVNGARTITNCVLGTNLDALADNHYWSPSTGRGEVVDVAPRLGE